MDVELSSQELEEALSEQLAFLAASAAAYDSGFTGEIKRLAVAARVLVHDTAKSTSLLKLLGRKDNTSFLDTAVPVIEGNLLSHSSLVLIHLSPTKGSAPLPLLDETSGSVRPLPFDQWWNGIVFVDQEKNEFSRKDVVLTLANKEGGAHVDHKLDAKWQALRKNNTLGWMDQGHGRATPSADQVPATMRQIAHELLKTLQPDYACATRNVGDGVLIMGAAAVVGDTAPVMPAHNLPKNRPMIGGRKIGRNDPCPCGSGRKYKHCCIA